MALVMPQMREMTVEDLADTPDDGHRYELIDGGLIVTPAPGTNHQICSIRLGALLHSQLPAELTVIAAPYDYRISPTTQLEPDLLIARTSDLGPARLEATPLLVVEILSRSTRYYDLGTKRLAYAAAGVPNYWIVDVASRETASVTALELGADGAYAEAAVVTGEQAWTDPVFGVTVVPAELVGPAPTAP